MNLIKHQSYKQQQGFTLIELMVTIAIVAIVTTLAAPAMSDFIKDNRLTAQANEFVVGVRFARSEAIKRGATISLERKDANWGNGWQVKNGNNILKEKLGETGITSSTAETQVTYTSRGIRDSLADFEVKLCDSRGKGRTITLTGLGGFSSVCRLGYGADNCLEGSCP